MPDNLEKYPDFWVSHAITKIKPGRKYTKVDMGGSGVYMIVNETGEIFGIKGYGVIYRGHQYGTLDTINLWYWGEYQAYKKTVAPLVNKVNETKIICTPAPETDLLATLKVTVEVNETELKVLRTALDYLYNDIDDEEIRLLVSKHLSYNSYDEVSKFIENLAVKIKSKPESEPAPKDIHVIIFVEGGLVQGASANSPNVSIGVVDQDCVKSGDMYEDEAKEIQRLIDLDETDEYTAIY